MGKVMTLVSMALFLGTTTAAVAETREPGTRPLTRAERTAECRREAAEKKFGIHFIQRNRFMRICMARRRG